MELYRNDGMSKWIYEFMKINRMNKRMSMENVR